MASPVMVCLLPVFLYFPVTYVNNIIKFLIRFRWDTICWIEHVIRLGWHAQSWIVILVILTVQPVEVTKEIVTPLHLAFLGVQLGTTWWFVLNLQKSNKQYTHTDTTRTMNIYENFSSQKLSCIPVPPLRWHCSPPRSSLPSCKRTSPVIIWWWNTFQIQTSKNHLSAFDLVHVDSLWKDYIKNNFHFLKPTFNWSCSRSGRWRATFREAWLHKCQNICFNKQE